MNNRAELQTSSRREFFRGSARYGLLSALAGIALWNARHPGGFSFDRSCINEGVCGACPVFAGCGLPPALLTRKASVGG